MILKFRVYEQTISLQSTKAEPRQGSRDYLELQFSFSSDWNDLSKYVYIQHGEVSVPHDLVDGSVIVDEYFTEQTEFNVTLFGKSADGSVEVPTNVITVFLKESNNLWEKDAPEPQNSWVVQVIDARDEALAAAIRAENAAIHQPYPNAETGTWWVWDVSAGAYTDTGNSYKGESSVQSDWNQNDDTQPDYIKNKPLIVTSFKPAGKSYLTFSSPSSFTLKVNDATKHWDGTLEYFAPDKTWTVWDGTTTLSAVNDDGEYVLYLRGTGNTKIGYYDYDTEDYIPWVINGTDVRCNGNIETLLDYATVEAGQHPTMAYECFIGLFKGCIALSQAPDLPATTLADSCYYAMFQECTSLAQAPALPATTLAPSCYSSMFQECTSLAQAPALPATTLANSCYRGMFQGCTDLAKAPALPVTTLTNWCYYGMFYGCTSLKLSSTQTEEYTQEYRIPSSGEGVEATNALEDMFASTGGTFKGTPFINTTYYLSSDNMIVRETEIDTLNGYVGSMIDVAIAEHTSNPLNITGATVGQIAKITAVDDTGKPTAWEAADMPSGGGGASYRSWSKVWTLAVAEDIAGFTASNIDLDGKSEIMIVFISDSTASRTMTNGRLRINGVDAGKALFNTLPLKKESHSFIIIGRADVGIEYTTMQATAEYQTYPWQGEVKIVHRMVSGTGSIIQWTAGSTIEITQASATLGQGITIEIYVR